MEARRELVSVALSPQDVRFGTIGIESGASESGKVVIDITQVGASREHGVPVGLGLAVPRVGEKVGKVAMRIDPHRLAGFGQGEVKCRCPGPLGRIGEQKSFPCQNERPYGVLSGVVTASRVRMVKEPVQFLPPAKGVVDRAEERRLGYRRFLVCEQPIVDRLQVRSEDGPPAYQVFFFSNRSLCPAALDELPLVVEECRIPSSDYRCISDVSRLSTRGWPTC